MDKYINWVYQDEVIIDSNRTREWAHTMASCIPAAIVRRILLVVHVTPDVNPRCGPASAG